LYNYFSEFPPIVKHFEYSNNICGEYTSTLLNNKFSKSKKFIATLKGEKLLIKSTRLKWLVEHGCIITKMHGVIEENRRKIFANFMNWVSDERRKGDIDKKYAIISECCETIGNSSFGRTIMDKNKHKYIKYGDEIKFNKCKNKFTFHNSDKYENVYEIVLNKKSIKQNMPLQVGCSVFDDSKLKMYQFYYDCIDKYIDRSNYQYIEMDCDSAYMALAADFNDLIKPVLKDEFELEKAKWFILNNYNKRTPGLFNIEFTGIGAIALCSKVLEFRSVELNLIKNNILNV